MRAKVGVENANSSESVGRFPSVVDVLISLPVDEVVSPVGSMFVSENPFDDEELLGFKFDEGCWVLILVRKSGSVGEEERDGEDWMNLEGWRKIDDVGDWGEFS